MTAASVLNDAEIFQSEGPTPLIRETTPAAPYPPEHLGPLKSAALAIQDRTQAPMALAANSVLSVAALAVQGLADVETLAGPRPTAIFAASIAESGERKSSCDTLAMKGVEQFQEELNEFYEAEFRSHADRLELWKTERAAIVKGAGGDANAKRADLEKLGPEPQPPLLPFVVSGEPTVEALVKNMPRLRASIGLFNDEAGEFLGGHSMKSENRQRTISTLSKAWDGKAIDRWRAGDGVARFPGRRLSAHFMMQPVIAEGLLGDPLANGQGFLARFLLCQPESRIGHRTWLTEADATAAEIDGFQRLIYERLRHPLPLRNDSPNELHPPTLALTEDARRLLQEFFVKVEEAQKAGGDLETVRPFASKAAEHAARIAGVLTLAADPEPGSVAAETMADAIELVVYYLGEAQRLTDAAVIPKKIRDAERMRVWLTEKWDEDFISKPLATRLGPFKSGPLVKQCFDILEEYDWLVPEDGDVTVRGQRPKKAWRVVRRAG